MMSCLGIVPAIPPTLAAISIAWELCFIIGDPVDGLAEVVAHRVDPPLVQCVHVWDMVMLTALQHAHAQDMAPTERISIVVPMRPEPRQVFESFPHSIH